MWELLDLIVMTLSKYVIHTMQLDYFKVHVLSTTSDPVGDGPVVRKTRGGGAAEFLRPPPVADYQEFISGVDRNMQH